MAKIEKVRQAMQHTGRLRERDTDNESQTVESDRDNIWVRQAGHWENKTGMREWDRQQRSKTVKQAVREWDRQTARTSILDTPALSVLLLSSDAFFPQSLSLSDAEGLWKGSTERYSFLGKETLETAPIKAQNPDDWSQRCSSTDSHYWSAAERSLMSPVHCASRERKTQTRDTR